MIGPGPSPLLLVAASGVTDCRSVVSRDPASDPATPAKPPLIFWYLHEVCSFFSIGVGFGRGK